MVVLCATPIYPAAVMQLILGLMTAALPLQAQTAPGCKPAAPTDVGVFTVAQSDVPYIRTLPGRAVAFETAEIRARVSGVVLCVAGGSFNGAPASCCLYLASGLRPTGSAVRAARDYLGQDEGME